jgi:hypothetical protein
MIIRPYVQGQFPVFITDCQILGGYDMLNGSCPDAHSHFSVRDLLRIRDRLARVTLSFNSRACDRDKYSTLIR